ncbi:MAG: transketolase C-terminal domain-containing protein [Dermatophilaceae bacterium]
MRARSLGHVELPIVVRIPFGGGIGAVEHHSESNEAYFAHTAGLRVVCCSNPHDALLDDPAGHRNADDPVIFFEPKRRYWDKGEIGPAPTRGLFEAATVRPGTDVTVLAYGPMVRTTLQAAQAAEEEGTSLEVIDLRSLSPLDTDVILESVRRTGRCIVVHEASTFLGLGAETRRPNHRSSASTPSRLLSCGSAATTCPTRRAGSRRTSSPTSTECSTPSTASWRTEREPTWDCANSTCPTPAKA